MALSPMTELSGLVKICREIYEWYEGTRDTSLDEVPEIDILEARKKVKELKDAIRKLEDENNKEVPSGTTDR